MLNEAACVESIINKQPECRCFGVVSYRLVGGSISEYPQLMKNALPQLGLSFPKVRRSID